MERCADAPPRARALFEVSGRARAAASPGLVVLSLLSLAVLPGGCWLEQQDFKNRKNPDFLVIGHRGAPYEEAENTLASLDAALAAGANAVEIDLCVTQDSEIVVWHDPDPESAVALARQSGLEGFPWVPMPPPSGDPMRRRVDRLVLTDFLATHGYARGGSRDPAAAIPTLDALLAWASASPALRAVYVDVKALPDAPEQGAHVVRELGARWPAGAGRDAVRFYFMSPHASVVEAMIAARDPLGRDELRVMRDFEGAGALRGAAALGLSDVSLGLTPIRTEADFLEEVEALLEARRDGDLDTVTAWTIDRRMQLGVLLYYGVDGIITNEPARLHGLWQATLR